MKRTAATYYALVYQGTETIREEHRALSAKDVMRIAKRNWPRADRVSVTVLLPSGETVLDDWRA